MNLFSCHQGDDEAKGRNTTQNNNHQVQPQPQQQQQQSSPLRQPEQLIVRRSFRKKQLPQIPKEDGILSPSSSLPGSPPALFDRTFSADQERSGGNSPNGEGKYGTLFLEYALMAEL